MQRQTSTQFLTKKQVHYFAVTFFLFLLFFNANAQTDLRKNIVGVNSTLQWAEGIGLTPTFGFSYERRFSNRHSFETGVRANLFKSNNYDNLSKQSNALLSMPLLYKYSSKIVDISAGPTLNHIAGPFKGYKNFNSGEAKDKFALGYMFKINKPLNLNDRLILDPEASVSGNQYFKKPQFGIGIGLKYKF